MNCIYLLIIVFVGQTSPASYEPRIDYFNNFNFKWEFGSLNAFELENVRHRRSTDWRPVKLKIELADKAWCNENKQISVQYGSITLACSKYYKLTNIFDKEPKVNFKNQYQDGKYYTLIMVDPDASRNSKRDSYLHWLVLNIKGGDQVSNGTELVRYSAPKPPVGTGKHRYIFLLFQQEKRQKRVDTISRRSRFSVNDYASNNGLTRVSGFSYFTTETKESKGAKRIKLRDL